VCWTGYMVSYHRNARGWRRPPHRGDCAAANNGN
jgi:hypothetical protein